MLKSAPPTVQSIFLRIGFWLNLLLLLNASLMTRLC